MTDRARVGITAALKIMDGGGELHEILSRARESLSKSLLPGKEDNTMTGVVSACHTLLCNKNHDPGAQQQCKMYEEIQSKFGTGSTTFDIWLNQIHSFMIKHELDVGEMQEIVTDAMSIVGKLNKNTALRGIVVNAMNIRAERRSLGDVDINSINFND